MDKKCRMIIESDYHLSAGEGGEGVAPLSPGKMRSFEPMYSHFGASQIAKFEFFKQISEINRLICYANARIRHTWIQSKKSII